MLLINRQNGVIAAGPIWGRPTTAAKYSGSCSRIGHQQSPEGNEGMKCRYTRVFASKPDELVFDLRQCVSKGGNGILLGRMRRSEIDSLSGGLIRGYSISSMQCEKEIVSCAYHDGVRDICDVEVLSLNDKTRNRVCIFWKQVRKSGPEEYKYRN